MKAGIDALPPNAKMFLNGGEFRQVLIQFVRDTFYTGEFYGHNASPANLEMIARFFEKYPEYVDRTFLSIKVGIHATRSPMIVDIKGPVPRVGVNLTRCNQTARE